MKSKKLRSGILLSAKSNPGIKVLNNAKMAKMWFFSQFFAKNGLASTKFGYFDKSPAFPTSIRSQPCMSCLIPIFWQLKTLGKHSVLVADLEFLSWIHFKSSSIIVPTFNNYGVFSFGLLWDNCEGIRGRFPPGTINFPLKWDSLFLYYWYKTKEA